MSDLQRTVAETDVGGGKTRCRVTLRDQVYTERGSQEARIRQLELLRAVSENPLLLACGPEPFETVHISHDGTSWVAIAEAVVRHAGR